LNDQSDGWLAAVSMALLATIISRTKPMHIHYSAAAAAAAHYWRFTLKKSRGAIWRSNKEENKNKQKTVKTVTTFLFYFQTSHHYFLLRH
jgi:hypothetical protein